MRKLFVIILLAHIICPGLLFGALTRTGTSGLINTPTTSLIGAGESNSASHLYFPESETVFSMKGTFGYGEKTEVSVSRFFSSAESNGYDVIFSPKYLLRPNMALGGVFDFSKGMKDSLYLISGIPENRVFLGAGLNLGKSNEKLGHFGGYNESGNVKTAFFLFGAEYDVEPQLKALFDYNGNNFSFGVRYTMDRLFRVDAGLNTKTFASEDNEFYLGVQLIPDN
ncbi:hypothetical protein ACFL35_12975 [Candidatus Riflebacteria bacterium]